MNKLHLLITFFSLVVIGSVRAEEKTYDLPQLISFIEEKNLELVTEKFIDNINHAEYKRIMKEFNPKLSLMFGAGPISKETGTPLKSQTDYTSWGVAWLGEAELTWPLYHWGRMEAIRQALKHKNKVDAQDIVLKRNEILYNLKESYYQALFTYSLMDFVNDILEKVTEKKDDEKTKKVDKFQLDILESQLLSKKEDIIKGQKLSLLAVKLFSGVDEDFSLDRNYIEREERELKEFDYYWNLALENKPEFIKLKEGIQAKSQYLESQKKENYPVIGVLINYEYSLAENTQKQQSTFAYDPYNRNDFSMGVGLKWNIDFGVTDEKIKKTGVEIKQLESKQRYANKGLRLLLLKAWEEVNAASNKLGYARNGYKSGKKWVNKLASSWAMGLTPTKKLVEAYQTYAFASKDYYEAILNHHLAWAKLSQEVGREVDPLLVKN